MRNGNNSISDSYNDRTTAMLHQDNSGYNTAFSINNYHHVIAPSI